VPLSVRRIEALHVLAVRHRPEQGTARVRAILREHGLQDLPGPNRFSGNDPLALWCSPSEWRLIARRPDVPRSVLAALAPGTEPLAYALDLSPGVAAFELHGKGIEAALARLVDAASIARLPGHGGRVRLGEVAVLLLRLEAQRAWILVDRAVQAWLAAELEGAAAQARWI
jgi:heterotetrameric sarcosine oxidase gamma subunit